MHFAVRLCQVTLALGLVVAVNIWWLASPIEDAHMAGIVAGFPFFGVAALALVDAIRRRSQPDTPLTDKRAREPITLLVLSGVWVFLVLLVWGR